MTNTPKPCPLKIGPAEKYPGITRAALEIAYDNGGINRFRSEESMLADLSAFLPRQELPNLVEIDAWLAGLSKEQLVAVCSGEELEQQELLRSAPAFTGQLLDDLFGKVC